MQKSQKIMPNVSQMPYFVQFNQGKRILNYLPNDGFSEIVL